MTQCQRRLGRLLSSEEKKRAKLQAVGVDYEFPGYKSATTPRNKAPSHTLFVDEDENTTELNSVLA